MAKPSSGTDEGLPHEDAWRGPLLAAVLRLSACVGTLWVSAVFAMKPELIRTVFGAAEAAAVLAVWFAALAPLSERARFAIIEGAFLGAAVATVAAYGTTPGTPVLLGLFVLLATIYHGRRGGVAAGTASLGLVAAGGYGWIKGLLPIGPRFTPLDPTQADFWVRTLFAQVLGFVGTILIVSFVLRQMRVTLLRLRFAEEKFSKAFRISPDAMIITELATGRFIEVNERHHRLTGFTRDEVLGRTSIEIGTFRDDADREEFAAPMRATGSVRQIERKIRGRDGRMIDVVYSSECFDLDGVRCAVTIIQDLTEKKRTEAALRGNEERFRSFVENTGVGIYRSTPDGRIVMANPALLRIMGYGSFEEMASRNLERPGYEPSYPREEFRHRLEREGHLSGLEAQWTRRDGSAIFVRESASVVRAPDGTVEFYDGIIEDISERKKAERALRESEERFRTLAAAAFEGIFITENGRILDANDQGLRMIGYERSEIIGSQVANLVSPETRAMVVENIRAQRELAYEHQVIRKDGSRFHALAQAKIMRMGDRTLRMTALQDITERRRTEERQKNLEDQLRQMQKMEALGTLAGGIAHDFNNILTGILGNLQIAEMDLPGIHPAYAALDAAGQASRRARDLIAQILSFSRPEKENRAPAPLGPVVLEALGLLRAGLPARVEVRSVLDPGCPPVLHDAGQIHQVIMNLGTNGIQAMREGGGVLDVELRPVSPDEELRARNPQVNSAHTVCLTLRDSGCGMEAAVLTRIFEPFYTTRQSGQGTGLGLAMVHAIIKSHKGAIVVDSAPGKGTRFDLYFPAEVAMPPVPGPASQRPAGAMDPFGAGRRVLIVDDDSAIRDIGANVLARLGFKPIVFSRPADALEAFRADPAGFALVISDLTMPGMTGVELAGHLLAARPGIPVILASGYLNTEARQRARDSGVRCLITKPFELRELVAQVKAVLEEGP